jgi:hypothetical protein
VSGLVFPIGWWLIQVADRGFNFKPYSLSSSTIISGQQNLSSTMSTNFDQEAFDAAGADLRRAMGVCPSGVLPERGQDQQHAGFALEFHRAAVRGWRLASGLLLTCF